MSKLLLISCAALALVAASSSASASVLYDDTAGAAVGPGATPSYESPSYSGYSPAQEFTATGSGSVSSVSFEFSNASVNGDPLTVSLWTTNAPNIAFDTEIGSWTFTSQVGANPFTQTIAVSGGPLLTSGVLYGIELSTSSTTTSTDWLTNSNVIVADYSVCNVAFYCTDPNGLTPTSNAVYFTGTPASGPQFLFAIDGVSSSGVPEPGAWTMLLAGLGGLGAALRMARRPSGAVLVRV
jgi:hypothetical protein